MRFNNERKTPATQCNNICHHAAVKSASTAQLPSHHPTLMMMMMMMLWWTEGCCYIAVLFQSGSGKWPVENMSPLKEARRNLWRVQEESST